MKLLDEAINAKDYCIGLRRHFHSHPELSLKEFETAKKVEEELDKLGIKHERVGETGVVGHIYGKNKGKVLALRADMDALAIEEKTNREYSSKNKGVMHACGHDGHTASLLLTASILKDLEFDGEIRLFFQQSEENGQGARQFINAGLCKDVDKIIAYHGASAIDYGEVGVTAGPQMASCDYFKIEVEGKAAHVSTPQDGIDALYIACQIVTGLQGIAARFIDPLDSVVVGIGKMVAGTTYNIVASNAVIEGTTRSFTFTTREKVNSMVTEIAETMAKAYGGKATVTFVNYADPLINDEATASELAEVAKGYADKVITNFPKRLGADDYADYLAVLPGVYMHVGTRNSDDSFTASPHHNEYFDIDERSMLLGSSIIVEYARQFFKK